jgi:uncharacterized protein (DUF2062 family)
VRWIGLAAWGRRFHLPADLLGMSPEAVASIVTLGVVLGVFPAPVCPTLLCALAALVLRLNPPAIQLVNYLVYPLQIALVAPFVSLGGRLFRTAPGPMTAHHAVWRTASAIWTAGAHAAAAWFCVSAPLGAVLYMVLAWVLRRRNLERADRTFSPPAASQA